MSAPKATIILLNLLAHVLADSVFGPRIFKGENASPSQFPFIVSLSTNTTRFGESHDCGASIIDSKWVLTAAHCVTDFDPDEYFIRAGTTSLYAGTTYTVDSMVPHEEFVETEDTVLNDIALIKINGEFTFDEDVERIGIGGAEAGDECTVIGWGKTERGKTTDLLFVSMTIQPEDKCVGGEAHPGQICAFGNEGARPCIGDSGGPLVCDGKVVGIVSYGLPGCRGGSPDIFTRVQYYSDWIDGVLNG